MYDIFLVLHNWMRWVVLLFAVLALYRAYRGWLQPCPWTPTDRRVDLFYGISIDIQLLLGLILYIFFSPSTHAFFGDLTGGQGIPGGNVFFFGVEHILLMIVAVALVHMGTAKARKIVDAVSKHRTTAIWYTASLIVIIIAIPWWRPLLRV